MCSTNWETKRISELKFQLLCSNDKTDLNETAQFAVSQFIQIISYYLKVKQTFLFARLQFCLATRGRQNKREKTKSPHVCFILLQQGPSQFAFLICLFFLILVGGIIAAPSVNRPQSGHTACNVIERDGGQKLEGL